MFLLPVCLLAPVSITLLSSFPQQFSPDTKTEECLAALSEITVKEICV